MSIDIEIFNRVGNKITDLSSGYKRINIYLFAGYCGIIQKALSKMASIVYGLLLKTKFYGDNAQENSKKDIDENKRIYTDIGITMQDILLEWDHEKYSNEHEAAMVISNMNKLIREMDENNIFYCWKYKGIYMFIMERDIRIWKCYNSKACLTPKTLKKIACVGLDMVSCMVRDVRRKCGDVDKTSIEKSFGHFINGLIDKMNPLVTMEISKWDGNQDISEYLYYLCESVTKIEDFKGLTFAEDIFDKFPYTISKKLKEIMSKEESMKTKQIKNDIVESDLEKEIIPENPNLAKPLRRKRMKLASAPSEKVVAYTFSGDINPFENASHFVNYYRAFLQQLNKDIRFNSYDTDAIYASQVLDLLKDQGRSNNKVFLMSWIRYFHDFKLKGNKFLKIKYTSIKAFKETFNEYVPRFMEI